MWEHGGRVAPGKTVHIQTKHDIVTKSVLTIGQMTADSAGMYSCMPDNISPATIRINIVNNTVGGHNGGIIHQTDLSIYFLLSIILIM